MENKKKMDNKKKINNNKKMVNKKKMENKKYRNVKTWSASIIVYRIVFTLKLKIKYVKILFTKSIYSSVQPLGDWSSDWLIDWSAVATAAASSKGNKQITKQKYFIKNISKS